MNYRPISALTRGNFDKGFVTNYLGTFKSVITKHQKETVSKGSKIKGTVSKLASIEMSSTPYEPLVVCNFCGESVKASDSEVYYAKWESKWFDQKTLKAAVARSCGKCTPTNTVFVQLEHIPNTKLSYSGKKMLPIAVDQVFWSEQYDTFIPLVYAENCPTCNENQYSRAPEEWKVYSEDGSYGCCYCKTQYVGWCTVSNQLVENVVSKTVKQPNGNDKVILVAPWLATKNLSVCACGLYPDASQLHATSNIDGTPVCATCVNEEGNYESTHVSLKYIIDDFISEKKGTTV
jgi:hypothetical protein